MSRNGTLEDALKSISDFKREHRAEEKRKEKEGRLSSLKEKGRDTSFGHEIGENIGDGDVHKQMGGREKRRKGGGKKRSREKEKRRSDVSEDETSEEEERSKSVKKSRKKHEDVEASSEDDRRRSRGRKKSDVDASSEDDQQRSRERRKRRKEKEREERRKGKRRRERRKESVSPESELDQAVEEIGRGAGDSAAAIRAAQTVLESYGELRSELVQLLSTLDAGQAVDISSIPDEKLKSLLAKLFHALSLQKSPLGLYLLPEGGAKTLQTLAPVLQDHNPTPPEKDEAVPSGIEAASEPNSAPISEERNGLPGASPIGPALPPRSENGSAKVAEGVEGPTATPMLESEVEPVREEVLDRGEIGPAGPPPAPKKRVIGPAAPPPEVLEAAAKMTEAEEELRTAYEEEDVLIGPPPPAMVAEADSAPEKERFDEVNHILAPTTRDPYALLRVKADASASEIKKRYWKLSLLVHPDKCAHPQAQNAFTALNKAFKEVEDPAKRAIVDAKLAEAQRKAEFAEELKALREAAQWRKLRGQSEPGDDELLGAAPEEEARDTWMTELPPERQAGTAMPMQSTYFSAKERTGRGDTSAWTDNPQEKAKKAQQQYLEAYSQAMLGPAVEEGQNAAKASATAQIIDSYNSKKRSQTLLEKHQEAMLKEKHKKKKKKEDTKQKEEWEGSHPWKPWDREKDLVIGKTVKLDRDSSATALASRFGAGRPGDRRFL